MSVYRRSTRTLATLYRRIKCPFGSDSRGRAWTKQEDILVLNPGTLTRRMLAERFNCSVAMIEKRRRYLREQQREIIRERTYRFLLKTGRLQSQAD